MSGLFDTESDAQKMETRARRQPVPTPKRDVEAKAEQTAGEALKIADDAARDAAPAEALQEALAGKAPTPSSAPRLLDDAQREKLSKIVDFRINAFRRHKLDAHEVRQVLLEVIANL